MKKLKKRMVKKDTSPLVEIDPKAAEELSTVMREMLDELFGVDTTEPSAAGSSWVPKKEEDG